MNKFLEIVLIIIAAAVVAIADVFLKKAAYSTESFWIALKNPLTIAVVALYLMQIFIFTYIFVKKAELGAVGIVQTALYAIIVVSSGMIFFHEKISFQQGIGMALALLGVLIIHF